MINKIEEISFKEIKRISPSQFYSMKCCSYKSLLAEAFDKKPLLPISLNAYFGTVLHKILDLIAKGVLKSEEDFNAEFEKQVKGLENDLMKNGFGFFVPLKTKVKNIGLKKVQLKKHLRSKSEQLTNLYNTEFHSERWLESKDKSIGGKIDLVIENNDRIEIVDFKTGAITEDYLDDNGENLVEVKNEYKEQLKLYAYLYFESTNKFPTKLSLVNLAKQKFPIKFKEEECKMIFEEAKSLLKTTNDNLRRGSFTANPKEENCRYCLYRPACSFFLQKLEEGFSSNDVTGKIKEVQKFRNGNSSLILQNGAKRLTIKIINSKKFSDYTYEKNAKIGIYNLRDELADSVYSITDTTMIYEQN